MIVFVRIAECEVAFDAAESLVDDEVDDAATASEPQAAEAPPVTTSTRSTTV